MGDSPEKNNEMIEVIKQMGGKEGDFLKDEEKWGDKDELWVVCRKQKWEVKHERGDKY